MALQDAATGQMPVAAYRQFLGRTWRNMGAPHSGQRQRWGDGSDRSSPLLRNPTTFSPVPATDWYTALPTRCGCLCVACEWQHRRQRERSPPLREGSLSSYTVEKLGFSCAPQQKIAYEVSALCSASAGPTAIEIAPASICAALTATGASRATCDLKFDFRRPRVWIGFFNRIQRKRSVRHGGGTHRLGHVSVVRLVAASLLVEDFADSPG